jgi:hypothetical protein
MAVNCGKCIWFSIETELCTLPKHDECPMIKNKNYMKRSRTKDVVV